MKPYEAPELVDMGPAESLVLGDKIFEVSDGSGTDLHEAMTPLDVD